MEELMPKLENKLEQSQKLKLIQLLSQVLALLAQVLTSVISTISSLLRRVSQRLGISKVSEGGSVNRKRKKKRD